MPKVGRPSTSRRRLSPALKAPPFAPRGPGCPRSAAGRARVDEAGCRRANWLLAHSDTGLRVFVLDRAGDPRPRDVGLLLDLAEREDDLPPGLLEHHRPGRVGRRARGSHQDPAAGGFPPAGAGEVVET